MTTRASHKQMAEWALSLPCEGRQISMLSHPGNEFTTLEFTVGCRDFNHTGLFLFYTNLAGAISTGLMHSTRQLDQYIVG